MCSRLSPAARPVNVIVWLVWSTAGMSWLKFLVRRRHGLGPPFFLGKSGGTFFMVSHSFMSCSMQSSIQSDNFSIKMAYKTFDIPSLNFWGQPLSPCFFFSLFKIRRIQRWSHPPQAGFGDAGVSQEWGQQAQRGPGLQVADRNKKKSPHRCFFFPSLFGAMGQNVVL